jgi:hypothetical protein
MRKLILALLIVSSLAACDKNEDLQEKTGILQSIVLDGCSYVIVLEDGTRLEPVANTSGIDLQPNKPFALRYRSKPTPSICMVGETVEIVSLRYL